MKRKAEVPEAVPKVVRPRFVVTSIRTMNFPPGGGPEYRLSIQRIPGDYITLSIAEASELIESLNGAITESETDHA